MALLAAWCDFASKEYERTAEALAYIPSAEGVCVGVDFVKKISPLERASAVWPYFLRDYGTSPGPNASGNGVK